LAEWRAKYPQVKLTFQVVGAKHPIVTAKYCTQSTSINNSIVAAYSICPPITAHGGTHVVCVKNETPKKILEVINRLRMQRGFKPRELTETKRRVSSKLSIQGPWTPDFVPPPLTPQAIANATVRINFRTVRGFDASKIVYPPSHLSATPPPQPPVQETKKLTKLERAILRKRISEERHQKALELVNKEREWMQKIIEESITENKGIDPTGR